jgi:hypothetical protein
MATAGASSIPRTIHCLWLQGEADLAARKPDLAAILAHNRAHAAAASPPWTLRVWSEDAVMGEAWPRLDADLRSALEPILASCPSHAARSDVLRLAVIAAEGGLYMDTDMMLLSDDFGWPLQGGCSLALAHDVGMTRADAWLFGSRGSNCFLAAAQGHPFVLAALQEIASAQPYRLAEGAFPDMSSAARRWTLRTTGPDMLQRLLYAPEWWARTCAPDGGIRLLPGEVVLMQRSGTSPADWVGAGGRRTPEALARSVRAAHPSAVMVHFSDNSWVSDKLVSLKRVGLAARNWGFENWLFVEVVFVLAIVLLLAAMGALAWRLTRTHEQRIASLRRRLARLARRRPSTSSR